MPSVGKRSVDVNYINVVQDIDDWWSASDTIATISIRYDSVKRLQMKKLRISTEYEKKNL